MGRKSSDVTSRIRSVVGKQAKESPRFPGPLPLSQTTQSRLQPECSPRAQILGQGFRMTPWGDRMIWPSQAALPGHSSFAEPALSASKGLRLTRETEREEFSDACDGS
jgi:hypothetical protein